MINKTLATVGAAVLTMGAVAGCASAPSTPISTTAPHRISSTAPAQPRNTAAAPLNAGTGTSAGAGAATVTAATTAAVTSVASVSRIPTYSHIVVVVLENHAYSQIVGSSHAPFLNSLITRGASLTRSYAVTHPSQPNYVALFSGSTHGLTNDSCPHSLTGPNLAASLRSHGRSFVGYSESLPYTGYRGCVKGAYARKHSPWINFKALPGTLSKPMSAFPKDLTKLPTVSFVVPNLLHDMHDGTIAQSDAWLKAHLATYAGWARTHNSLLMVTADEDDRSAGNHIATILTGAHVRAGKYSARVTHYGVLRSLLDSYRIAPYRNATTAARITGMWTK